jgi:nitroreductase
METLEAIYTRRSIRKFKDRPLSDKKIETILRAAMAAPSAMNEQPWHFVVIRDRAILREIGAMNTYARMAAEAPAAILVCGDTALERAEGFWVQDCSAAVENMLLTARALGLGAVWTAAFPPADRIAGYRRLFGLPATVIPLALVPIGYPGEEPPPADRFDQERIHYERW